MLLLPFKFYNITFNEFLYEFLRFFLISENSLKFAIFFAEVTNSRSMIFGKQHIANVGYWKIVEQLPLRPNLISAGK